MRGSKNAPRPGGLPQTPLEMGAASAHAFRKRLRLPDYREFLIEHVKRQQAEPFVGVRHWRVGDVQIVVPPQAVEYDLKRWQRREMGVEWRKLRGQVQTPMESEGLGTRLGTLVSRLQLDAEYAHHLRGILEHLERRGATGRMGAYQSKDGKLEVSWWVVREDLQYVWQQGIPDLADEEMMKKVEALQQSRSASLARRVERESSNAQAHRLMRQIMQNPQWHIAQLKPSRASEDEEGGAGAEDGSPL